MSTEVKNIVVALRARIGDFRKKMTAGGRSVMGFKKHTDAARASVGNLARTIKRAAIAAAAGFGITKLVGEASRLEETMNKFNVVFGDNAKAVKKWGDGFAKQVGRSRTQIAGFLAGTQDLLVPMGFTPGSAETMTKQIARLTVDLASFNNLQDSDVLRDIQAALTGSGEVMKKYGVIVSQAAVNQRLLNNGLDPKTATEAAKAQARMQIIMAGTTAAQGDAIRSSGSFANQMKGLKAAFTDTAASLGAVLLPMATKVVTGIKGVLAGFSQYAGQIRDILGRVFAFIGDVAASFGAAFTAIFEAIGGVFEAFGVNFSGIGSVVGAIIDAIAAGIKWFAKGVIVAVTFVESIFVNWRDTLNIVFKGAILGVVKFAMMVKHFFTEVVPAYLKWFGRNWYAIFVDMWELVKTVFGNMWENIKNFFKSIWSWLTGDGWDFEWTGLTEGFESTMEKLPEIAKRVKGPIEKALELDIAASAKNIKTYYNDKVTARLARLDKKKGGKAEVKSAAAAVRDAVKTAVKVPAVEKKTGTDKKPVVVKAARTHAAAGKRRQNFGVLGRAVSLSGLVGAFGRDDNEVADNTQRTAAALERMERSGKAAYFVG